MRWSKSEEKEEVGRRGRGTWDSRKHIWFVIQSSSKDI
jgi:hypothetical protein